MNSRSKPPTLETFYNVKQAAVRLGLANEENPDDESGQRWLRDGVNRQPGDGPRFPCHRLGRKLMFSESDLAEIAAMHADAPTRTGRPRRRRPAAAAVK
ncbi:hypothetical protein [Streptomyces sp. NPDC051994]|uniref:hypothetical protein n=1 Tax=unclassified Streptomyces TaxID=2593676 RepID=UPI00343D2A73